MKDVVIIDGARKQFRGAIHTHTTRSDGKFTLEQVRDMYIKAGFDFLFATDHEVYFDSDSYDEPGFLVLGGAESSVLMNDRYRWIIDYKKKTDEWYRNQHKYLHLGILRNYCVPAVDNHGHEEEVPRLLDRGLDSWNDFIASEKAKGNFVMVNHPHWSRMTGEEVLAMQGFTAMEVYNSEVVGGCAGETDEDIWDYCVNRGRRIRAVAADDFHGKVPLLGRGFTVVCADSLTREGICGALASGDFYASCGPRMLDMRIEGGVLKMKFSPCTMVKVVCYDRTGKCIGPFEDDHTFTECEWAIDPLRKWFRVELIDEKGRKAWMQPVFMEDLIDE